MSDVTADYLALRRGVGAMVLRRDVVLAHGNDAEVFLQGQLSQDVAALGSGSSAWSLLLTPEGRLGFWPRVTRLGEKAFALDVDAGLGPEVIERLGRFKLRVDCELRVADEVQAVAFRGPESAGLAVAAESELARPATGWAAFTGFDVLAAGVTVPDGVPIVGAEAYEAVRIEAGFPGPAELVEGTIAAEVGIVESSVSFTKGCFVGQELVARIDSRGGNVPRRLRGVVVGTAILPPPGAEIVADEAVVGHLTSVAESLDRRAPVALAYVARKVEPPADVTVVWDGGEAPARVEALPLVS